MKPDPVYALLLLSLLPGSFACAGRYPGAPPRRTELPADSTVVPASWDGNLPLVEVFLGERGPYRFLLDTGAGTTLVTPECAAEASLDVRYERRRIGGAVGSTHVDLGLAMIPELRLGGARFEGVFAILGETAGDLDGILGFPVFGEVLLTLDGPRREIRLSRGELPAPGVEPSCLALEPTSREEPCPRARGSIAGHQGALFLIDSGFDGVLFLARSIPRTYGFDFEPDPEQGTRVRTRLGEHEVVTGTLREEIEIGPITRRDVPTMTGMGLPVIVGGGFLRQLVTTFDQRRGLVRLMEPPRP